VVKYDNWEKIQSAKNWNNHIIDSHLINVQPLKLEFTDFSDIPGEGPYKIYIPVLPVSARPDSLKNDFGVGKEAVSILPKKAATITIDDRKKFLETLINPPKKNYKCLVDRDSLQRPPGNTGGGGRFEDRCPLGEKCNHRDCKLKHPTVDCKHGRKCKRPYCLFLHRDGRSIDDWDDDASDSSDYSRGSSYSNSYNSNSKFCPRKLFCRNPDCTLLHPRVECKYKDGCSLRVCHALHSKGRKNLNYDDYDEEEEWQNEQTLDDNY